MGSKPLGSNLCQRIEGMTQGLSYPFESIEHADGCQDMGGVGPLTTPCLEQPLRFEMVEHHLEELHLAPASDQTRPKFAQYGKVKARMSQFQGKCILPIDALLDRLGGLSIRQAFNELEDADQGEPPGASAG
jgi:hypothetical protein